MAGPKTTLEIGFKSDPTVPIASTVWEDVSAYLLDHSGSGGGRNYELDRAVAGKMKIRLNNKDRRFEPEYGDVDNYVQNPIPVSNMNGWSPFVPTGSPVLSMNADGPIGGWVSAQLAITGMTGANNAFIYDGASPINARCPIKPGQKVFVHAYAKVAAAAGSVTSVVVEVRWYDTTGGYITEAAVATQNSPVTGTWYQLSGLTAAAPAGAAYAGIGVYFVMASGATATLRATGFRTVPAETVPNPLYVDGATDSNHHWETTPYASRTWKGAPYAPFVIPLRRVRLKIGENYIANPSFETDLASWTSGGATFTRDAATFLIGLAAAKIVSVGASGNYIFSANTILAPLSGSKIQASAYVKATGSAIGKTAYVQINETGGAFAEQSTQGTAVTLDGTWQRVTVVLTFKRTDRTGWDVTVCGLSFATGNTLYIDGVQEATSDQIQPYTEKARELFTGFIEDWPTSYEPRWSYVDVSCVDGFEPLAQAGLLGGENNVVNGNFDVDLSGWTFVSGGTLARDASRAVAGAASGKITAHASAATEYRPSFIQGLEAGKKYAASARVYVPSGLGIAGPILIGLGVTGGSEVYGQVDLTKLDQWQTVVLPSLFSGAEQVRTFGRTTAGTGLTLMQGDTASNGDPIGNNKQVTKFTLADPALITSLHMDITGHGGAGPQQMLRGVIYSDSAGTPGTKLGETEQRTIPRNTALRQFEQFNFATPVLVPAGTYWIGYIGGETSQALYIGSVAAGGNRAYNTDPFSDGASDSFGSATTDTLQLAIYATYTVSLASISYGFARMADVGVTKSIWMDEIVVREVPAADAALIDPAGADLSQALAGLRIHRALNAANWPVADRAIDTGTSTLAGETVASDSDAKVLNELHSAADADLGVFFCDPAGKAVFHGRARRFNPLPVCVFTDQDPGPGVFQYEDLTPVNDKTRLANDVRITPAVGTRQTVTDATSDKQFMQRPLAKSLALAYESEAKSIAQGILARLKDPHKRFETMKLKPVVAELLQPGTLDAVLARVVSDCITVRSNPPGPAGQVTKNVHVEKRSWKATLTTDLEVTFQLSPVDETTYWTLVDPVYGAPDENGVAF